MAMFDMTAVSAALASIKALYDLVRNANDAQLAMRISGEIANIQGRLIDVQQQALALQEENYRLNEELAQLQRSIEEEKLLDFKHGVYWRGYSVLTLEEDEEGNRISELRWEGPFCPLCKDVDGKAVRLKDIGPVKEGSKDRSWRCEVHKNYYPAPAKW